MDKEQVDSLVRFTQELIRASSDIDIASINIVPSVEDEICFYNFTKQARSMVAICPEGDIFYSCSEHIKYPGSLYRQHHYKGAGIDYNGVVWDFLNQKLEKG